MYTMTSQILKFVDFTKTQNSRYLEKEISNKKKMYQIKKIKKTSNKKNH